MDELSERDKKLISDIEKLGWIVFKVLEDDRGPGFCYSVGLYKHYQHPEIVIVGLKLDLAHILINEIGESIKEGKKFHSGEFYPEILDDFRCLMVNVDKEYYQDYFGYGLWYYKDDAFPVLQCIYPTIKGIYPWEEKWPEDLADIQPILGDISKISN